MDDGRPITVAVIGPADLTAEVAGPIGYRRGARGVPAAAVPTAYVPYSPLWLYAPRAEGSACFVMREGKRLIGPLGPGARELGTGGMALGPGTSLPRALAALDGMAGDFTARDLALRLRGGLRTAHRALLRFREEGYVVEVGQETRGTRGRPRRVFRLSRGAPNGEGGGRA